MTDESTNLPKQTDHRTLAIVLAFLAAATLGFAAFSSRWLHASVAQLQFHDGDRIVEVGPVHEVGFGLRTMFRCEARCEAMTNGELVDAWRREQLVARFMLGEEVGDELKALGGVSVDELASKRAAASDPNDPLQAAYQHELVIRKQIYTASGSFVTFGWIALVGALLAAISLAAAAALVLAKKRVALPIMPTTTALLGIAVALVSGCLFVAMKPGPPGYVGVSLGFFVFGAGVILGLWSSLALNKLLRPADPDLLEDAMNPDQF